MSTSDSASAQSRRTRGVTRLPEATSGQVPGQRKHLEIDPRTGVTSGPNVDGLSSYLGKIAKTHVFILHATWDDVPEVEKNLLWLDVQLKYDVPNTLDMRVTRLYVFGKRQHENPSQHYSFTEEEWMRFRQSRETEEWKGKSLAAHERQRLHDAPHVLSRGGYAKLEKKLRKDRVDELGLESPDLAPPPTRYEMWKAARTKSDGNMTSASAGTFTPQGREDILTTTIGKPEPPRRVRAVPGSISLRDYFGPATLGVPTETPTTPPASTKGSCSAVEPTDYIGQYDLLVNGDPARIVAVGRVVEGGQIIHGVPISPQHVHVLIDEVRDPQAQVPVPTLEVQFVGKAIGSFLAWPRALVITHIGTQQFTRPQKQPMHEASILEDDDGDDMAEAEDDPIAKLIARILRFNKGSIQISWDLRVFVYITLNDVSEIISGDKMLNISIIQLRCMYMDTVIVDQDRSSVYEFVEHQTVQRCGNTAEIKQNYLQTWMTESNRDIYLVPYIDGYALFYVKVSFLTLDSRLLTLKLLILSSFMTSEKYDILFVRLNEKNYSAWAFQFQIFVIGKDFWGHVDGSTPAPHKDKEQVAHAKWAIKDAQVMAWILSFVDSNIVLNLRPYKTASTMWSYLQKIYSQNNAARRFQLEHNIANFKQDSLSISDFYSQFMNLWAEYTDIVYANLPSEGLNFVQTIHDITKRDQFLMKLRSDFEGIRSNLMHRDLVPSLDACLNELLREEQRKSRRHDMSTIQCFSCKRFGHYASTCPKKFCNYCKKDGHIIKECPIRPPRQPTTTFITTTVSSILNSSTNPAPIHPNATTDAPTLTLERVQQMIISAFSALGLSGNSFSPWYFDSGDSNHMTNNARFLTNIKNYSRNLTIHTAGGNQLPITEIGDISPFLTNVFVALGLTSNLIFVGQLVDNNCRVQFSQSGCFEFLQSNGILSQRSCPSTPQQNRVAERKNRHLLDVVCTLFLESHVPSRFWCEALSTAVHLIIKLSSPSISNESPFTRLFGHPPDYSTLRIFGCACYVHIPPHERTKLTAQFVECAFLGYSPHQKGFLCDDPNLHRIRVSRNVIFLESVYFFANHHDSFSSPIFVLPLFSNSSTGQSSSRPLLTHQRRNTTTQHHLAQSHGPLQDTSLDTDPVQAPKPEPAPLRRSSRIATLSYIPIPSSHKHAMKNECWKKAIESELLALKENQTWDIVSCPPSVKPLGSKFVFSIKLCSDGSIDRYKAQLVVLGNKQEYGLDYDETFAPVAKMTTVRTILALTASKSWPLHQMDVKNAFLHGDLKEEVYITLPGGMSTLSQNTVCKLKRSLYGLKQAPRVWFEKFCSTLFGFSFNKSQYDSSLFLQWTPKGIVILRVYVDDIVVTGSDQDAISRIKQMLNSTFHMKELGHLNYFLGLEVHYHPEGIFVNQHKYIQDLVQLAGLTNATPVDTPMKESFLTIPLNIGSLIYVTITRPDISYVVHTVSKFMQSPRHFHFSAVQRIIKYLLGTSSRGLFFPGNSSLQLQAYSDADLAGCPDTRRSTIGCAMSAACSEITWLRGLLTELGVSQAQPTPLHADNTSAVQIAVNPVYHERTKHIEVDCHSIREAYDRRVITLPHVSTVV
ncbi:hypothetical protein V8G54_010498 [Vigna mungo]|uniref:Retrovirus-related Pol polyprotein from transposon TNT 1-94 n=1 Tax=Vigna mungo TaxID=3915 RepID=A0AAQ3NVW7_VIGMU